MKKKLRISFNGKTYDVVAEILDDDEPARPIAPTAPLGAAPVAARVPATPTPAAPAASIAGTADGGLPSPLAGKVVSIDAKVGARVRSGQPVITLEAMKMNTVVAAPTDGTVTAVHVNPGDSVEEGQLLLVIK